jgi:hypothetical protein
VMLDCSIYMLKAIVLNGHLNIPIPQQRQTTVLPLQSTTKTLSKPSLTRITSILGCSSLVSIRKTKLGFLSPISNLRVQTFRGFPSPWQFQLRRVIGRGGAIPQPSPVHAMLGNHEHYFSFPYSTWPSFQVLGPLLPSDSPPDLCPEP